MTLAPPPQPPPPLLPRRKATDLAARGWNQQDLSTFLKHGMSAQGTMFNEMFPVFHNSTQGLNDQDLAAMATFLLGDQPPAATLKLSRGAKERHNVMRFLHRFKRLLGANDSHEPDRLPKIETPSYQAVTAPKGMPTTPPVSQPRSRFFKAPEQRF